MKTLAAKRKYEGMSGAWLIVVRGDRLLVGRRSKACGEDIGKYNFIGGGVDDTDESPKHAAVREFKEECGVDMMDRWSDIQPLLSVFNPTTGGTCHFFTLRISEDEKLKLEPNEEHDKLGWVPLMGTNGSLMSRPEALNWPTMTALMPLYSEFQSL